jgi:hypothetical protein
MDALEMLNKFCGSVALIYAVAELLYMGVKKDLLQPFSQRDYVRAFRVIVVLMIGAGGGLLIFKPSVTEDAHAAAQTLSHVALALWCVYGLIRDVQQYRATRAGNEGQA